jgi:DNA-binding NtrC family response regulator
VGDILVIDDEDRTMELCRRSIPEHRYRGPARSWREAERELERRDSVDLVLLDVVFDVAASELLGATEEMGKGALDALRRRQGLEILAWLRRRWPELPVVLMTSREELPLAASSGIRAEEYTWFLDDDVVDAQSLRAQIEGILGARRGEETDGPVYWGRSLTMRRLRRKLEVLARGRLPVVLLGPTGSGKSLVARHVVHARSGREGRFVSVDLSTIPRELGAAHLFGAVKGAYTGSVADRTGAFEAAHGGTLFLDELGNLSSDAQKMLLQVLQEGAITRLGEMRERPVDVKLVVASNEDLSAKVADGSFRADLYMRLNPATTVTLPALVDRAPEWDRLLSFTLAQALDRPYLQGLVADYREAAGLPAGSVEIVSGATVPERRDGVLVLLFPEPSMRALAHHRWPGNLREFAMVAENAVLFALAEQVGLPPGDRPDVVQVRPKLVRDLLHADVGPAVPGGDGDGGGWGMRVVLRPHDTLNKVAVDCERQYFVALWRAYGGDFSRMAEVLLGDSAGARKVQLRFNQLGLKVRDLKERAR